MSLTPYFDAYFNPLILDGFFMGFYFLLYAQAVWKLCRKKIIGTYLFALTILWMSLTSYFIFGWVRARNAFVINNDSPQTILTALLTFADNTPFVTVVVATIFSDGILIWRCYVFWQKKWVLCVLATLLLVSSICNIAFISLPEKSTAGTLLWAIGSLFSAVTSLIATCMIAKKVMSGADNNVPGKSYPKGIEILVQSAALQSVVLLVNCVVALIIATEKPVFGTNSDAILTQMNAYIFTCSRAIMGIAPTLIAFRVAYEKPLTTVDNNASRSGPLSRLTFRRTARGTETESGPGRTRISTIRFGTVRRDNAESEILSNRGLDNELEKKESNEKTSPELD